MFRGGLSVALLLGGTQAHAGAWLQPDGERLVIATTDYTIADTAFDDEREAVIDVEFRKVEARTYVEWGARDWLTLTQESAFQDVWFEGLQGPSQYQGPSAVRTGARRSLWSKGRHRISLATDVGYQRGGEFISDGELGYEGWSATGTLLYGHGWDRAFVDIQAGYRHRFGQGPDTWRGDATAGYDLTRRWSLFATASGRITDGDQLGLDLLEPTESLKLKGAIAYRWSCRTRLELGGLYTAYGRNHVRERGATIGIWRRFGKGTDEQCFNHRLRHLDRRIG